MKKAKFLGALAVISLAACSWNAPPDPLPPPPVDIMAVPDAVPKIEPKAKYGNPDSYLVFGQRYHVSDTAQGYKEQGLASWYGEKFHGRLTSSREPYDMFAMTAAHKSLPIPAYVRVTNLSNGKQIVVRVNDRGPFVAGRIIDLSYTAAVKLGMAEAGVTKVEVEALNPGDWPSKPQTQQASKPVLLVMPPAPELQVADAGAAVAEPLLDADTAQTMVDSEQGLPELAATTTPAVEELQPVAKAAAEEVADDGKQAVPMVLPVATITGPPKPHQSLPYLQVGAFKKRASALQRLQEVQQVVPYDVRIKEPGLLAEEIYRVRIGPFADMESAKHIQAYLKNEYSTSSVVVTD